MLDRFTIRPAGAADQWQQRLRERDDREEIRVERLPQDRFGHAARGVESVRRAEFSTVELNARVVDEDVEPSEPLFQRFGQPSMVVPLPHVEFDRLDVGDSLLA